MSQGREGPGVVTPEFSIVTATYNAGALLARTMSSLQAQTRRPFQWIVIDGGSKDDTVERIKAAGPLVSDWVSERDEGIADAWNKGIARATGSHVLILNAGDTYDSTFLETVARHCNLTQITCSHARLVSNEGREVGVFHAHPEKLRRAMHLPHNWCAVPTHYYRTLGAYRKIPLAMDFDWLHRYFKRFGTAGFNVVDEVLGSYYLGGASDQRYAESFKANERILIENGGSVLMARLIRIAYSLKHTLKYRVLPQD